jgi:UDP-N-acetylmuramyl-tripeptide synthetase
MVSKAPSTQASGTAASAVGVQLLTSPDQVLPWARALGASAQSELRSDSRLVQPGDVFLAWPGAAADARHFCAAALNQGAVACLIEADGAAAFAFVDPRVAAMPNLKAASGAVAHAWYGQPSQALQLLAVTGTNGKTSTSWWLAQALAYLGRRCAVVGTLGVGELSVGEQPLGAAARLAATGLTTPDPVTLHASLARLLSSGVQACAVEASSIGLAEHRLAATHIDVALFSNLTQDHLDYHGDMATYWAAKRCLFDWPGLRAAVVNVDDATGAALASELQGGALQLISVGFDGPADNPPTLRGHGLRFDDGGLAFEVAEGTQRASVRCALVGRFNASNLLLVLGGLRALGFDLHSACAALAALAPVPGRMQRVVGHDGVQVVVDYAHTPDALDQVLRALAPVARARAGKLWCVVGCGGDRDASKRPLMAAIAQRGAQRVVLTSDNPRSEDPLRILAQMQAGLNAERAVSVVSDRRQAIHLALSQAAPGDVVLLAGKGHETSQEVAGVKLPFSDLEEARLALAQRPQATGVGAAAAANQLQGAAC